MTRASLVFTALAALVAGAATPAAPQPSAAPSTTPVADAQQLLQSNDAPGAVRILEAFVQHSANDADAWHTLGQAYRQTKNPGRALEAFRRELALRPASPQAFYDIAAVHALRNDTAQAIEWLTKARASRQVDMSQIDADADLASLRGDSRLRPLRPTDADFADPFVERVRILREWRGETANEQFGWIARKLADVDGDGVADVVTSAPTNAIGGANAGRIYVFSTGSGGLRWTADGAPGDRLGIGVEAAGDTNHDGVADVIASAPGGGYAKVYSGRDGAVLLTLRAEDRGDLFGRHVAGVGDIDGDGHADVIVGAPGNSAAGKGAGRAYVYSGKDGRTLLTFTGERAGDAFGSAVSGAADGKTTLLLVGAPGAGPAHHGRTYVYDGRSAAPKFVIEADDTGAALGAMFLAVPGDVDGDGVPDVYASDFSNAAR